MSGGVSSKVNVPFFCVVTPVIGSFVPSSRRRVTASGLSPSALPSVRVSRPRR